MIKLKQGIFMKTTQIPTQNVLPKDLHIRWKIKPSFVHGFWLLSMYHQTGSWLCRWFYKHLSSAIMATTKIPIIQLLISPTTALNGINALLLEGYQPLNPMVNLEHLVNGLWLWCNYIQSEMCKEVAWLSWLYKQFEVISTVQTIRDV